MERPLYRTDRVRARFYLAAGQVSGRYQIFDRSAARRVDWCHHHAAEERKENLGELRNWLVLEAAEDQRQRLPPIEVRNCGAQRPGPGRIVAHVQQYIGAAAIACNKLQPRWPNSV